MNRSCDEPKTVFSKGHIEWLGMTLSQKAKPFQEVTLSKCSTPLDQCSVQYSISIRLDVLWNILESETLDTNHRLDRIADSFVHVGTGLRGTSVLRLSTRPLLTELMQCSV